MTPIEVRIAVSLVARIRETTLLLFEATAEALWFALGAMSRDPGVLPEVRGHYLRLSQSAALLDQLGWTADEASGEATVAAAPDVLHDAVLGSLLDAGESMAGAIHEGAQDVQVQAREVVALDALLKEVNRHR